MAGPNMGPQKVERGEPEVWAMEGDHGGNLAQEPRPETHWREWHNWLQMKKQVPNSTNKVDLQTYGYLNLETSPKEKNDQEQKKWIKADQT